jgi:7-carboxy-7-deazaguanine synthase
MLRVSQSLGGPPEIFHSLQGEGPTIGTPSVFLRLAQCNLACDWCDTKYTWDWKNYDYDQEVVSLDSKQVENHILQLGCNHLVITGGEPLIQQSELVPLVNSLRARNFYCEIETNGTIVPMPELARNINQWNVSPKLQNSGNTQSRREVHKVLEFFCQLSSAYFKFVVVAPSDLVEIGALQKRYKLPNERIILMPEGQTANIIQSRSQWISEACIREGFRFSSRLHVMLWGNKRGK